MKKIIKIITSTVIIIASIIFLLFLFITLYSFGFCNHGTSSRDHKRICDLRSVQKDIEIYFRKCGYYPGVIEPNSRCSSFMRIGDWSNLNDALTRSNLGIKNIPNDPAFFQNWASPYFYGTNENGTSYVIGAKLENANNSELNESPSGTIYGVDCDSPVYCIKK